MNWNGAFSIEIKRIKEKVIQFWNGSIVYERRSYATNKKGKIF